MVLPEIAHPGIVGFNEAFYYKKNLWLLLEYCAGVCVCVCVCACVCVCPSDECLVHVFI
jgi:hypothetical protein